MYKPAPVRQFVTEAIHKKPATTIINGHNQKTYTVVGTLKGKVKHPIGTVELNANGLSIIENKTTYTTWFSNNIEAHDVLTIGGIDYEIDGTPENVEDRGRYIIIKLRKLEGGA